MLTFVPSEMSDPAPYRLLTSIIAPRPIAWVSTVNLQGVPNLAPFSFYNAVAGFPPTIMFSVSYRRAEPHEKHTLRNVRATGEFVCHVVDEDSAESMIYTAADWPDDYNEMELANLPSVPCIDVRPPRIASAPVAMECKVTQIIPVEGATNVMVLGQVLRFHIHETLYRPELGLVDTVSMRPLTRLGGAVEYARMVELVYLPVPSIRQSARLDQRNDRIS